MCAVKHTGSLTCFFCSPTEAIADEEVSFRNVKNNVTLLNIWLDVTIAIQQEKATEHISWRTGSEYCTALT